MEQDIKRLAFVLGLGGFVGLVGVLLLAFFWGPSGRYHLDQVLLSPDTIQKMDEAGGRYHLDRITLERFDPKGNKRTTFSISQNQYKRFFTEIMDDQSLKKDQETIDLFMDPHLTKLTLYVSGEPFQELQMIRGGNYYRIQLHEDQKRGSWVYFKRPGIEKWAREALYP